MWAALKSPLLLGNDLRDMDAKTLSIINNPAIIAINQDPRGRAVQRVVRNFAVPKDQFGVGETHIWTGPLANGDQILVFLNVADEEMNMAATLEEVFITDGVGGTAPQIQQDWVIFDLWGSRMSEKDAQNVLDSKTQKGRQKILHSLNWYNATETPYAKGLEVRDERLFGKKIGSVSARGKIEALVPRHAAKVFRLQSVGGQDTTRKSLLKDEL